MAALHSVRVCRVRWRDPAATDYTPGCSPPVTHLRNISALSAFPSATAPSARGYLAALPAGAPLPYAYMLACAPNLHHAVSPSASSAAVRVYGHRTVLRVCSLERLVC